MVEKSRQMYISWCLMICYLWSILFFENRTYCIISEKEQFVDDTGHTHNSLLGKIHCLVAHLPEKWRQKLILNHGVINNPSMNSAIIGQTANANAGRSGSWAGALMDEAAHIWLGETIYGSLQQACPWGRILVSTPNPDCDIGEDVFSRLRWDERSPLPVHTLHWSQHPERQCDCEGEHHGCWYARQCEDMTQKQIAAELDIKYGRAKSTICFYAWDRARNVRRLGHDPGLPVIRSWDFGVGTTAVLTAQLRSVHTASGRVLKQIRILDHYENHGQGAGHYRDAMADDPKRYRQSRIFDIGDPYILDQRHSNLSTWRSNMADRDPQHPYQITVRPAACEGVSIENLIENVCRMCQEVETKEGAHEPLLLVDERCKDFIRHLENYAYPTDRQGNRKSDKPNKDAHSHAADALQYLAWDQCPPGRGGSPKKAAVVGYKTEVPELGFGVEEYGL